MEALIGIAAFLLGGKQLAAQTEAKAVTVSGMFVRPADSHAETGALPRTVFLWRDDSSARALLDSTCNIARRDPAQWRVVRTGSAKTKAALSGEALTYAPLLRRARLDIIDSARTNSRNEFTFHNVHPGEYYLFAELPSNDVYLSQWWSHTSIDGSSDVTAEIRADRGRSEQFCRPRVVPADSIDPAKTYREFQVEVPAGRSVNDFPRYPPELLAAGIDGDVDVEFVVDSTGRVDMQTFTILDATDGRFAPAVEVAVANSKFTPAEIDGRKVSQVVSLLTTFRVKH